jgi:hypothetical protein
MINVAAHHPRHDQTVFCGIVRSLVVFRRCLVQALKIDSSPVLQLPHCGAISPKLLKDAPSFREIVSGRADGFLDRLKLSPQERLDVDAFCRHAPLVELSCHIEVDDEEGLALGDVATLTISKIQWPGLRLVALHGIARSGGFFSMMSVTGGW